MYTLGPSVSLPSFYGIFDWSNFSWRNFIFLWSFYWKVGRRETHQIFRIFGYYPFLHHTFWTHFCSAQLYRNPKYVAEKIFTFGLLTLISIIENAQEHTNAPCLVFCLITYFSVPQKVPVSPSKVDATCLLDLHVLFLKQLPSCSNRH